MSKTDFLETSAKIRVGITDKIPEFVKAQENLEEFIKKPFDIIETKIITRETEKFKAQLPPNLTEDEFISEQIKYGLFTQHILPSEKPFASLVDEGANAVANGQEVSKIGPILFQTMVGRALEEGLLTEADCEQLGIKLG